MDRRVWQEHLILCSKLMVRHARLYSTHVGLARTILMSPCQSEDYPYQREGKDVSLANV